MKKKLKACFSLMAFFLVGLIGITESIDIKVQIIFGLISIILAVHHEKKDSG